VTQNGEKLEGEHRRNQAKSWFNATNAVAYTRASGVAKFLESQDALIDWAAAQSALGVVRNPAIAAGLSALASQYQDPWNEKAAKPQLKDLAWRARQAAGAENATDIGTAVHQYAELVDAGKEPEFMDAKFRAFMDEYKRAMAGIEVVGAEGFVVQDELKIAGSYDRLVRLPDGAVVVADIKTSKSADAYPMSVTVQTGIYANSVHYNQETGERWGLHPDLDRSRSVLIHFPVRSVGAVCRLWVLDAAWGFEAARLAMRVRESRKAPKPKELVVA
jgi:hypothetical protein